MCCKVNARCAAMCSSELQWVAECCTIDRASECAVCCSVLQCVAVRCSVLHGREGKNVRVSTPPVCGPGLIRMISAVWCSLLQYVAACCSVLQCAAVCCSVLCCSMLQCMQRVAMYCTVLQCAAICCNWWSRRCCSQSVRERVCERKTEGDNTIQQAREQQRARAREAVGI